MINALSTAATGLEAQSANIERISTDLANVNTDGYKRSRTEFKELMYKTTKEPGEQLGAGTTTPVGVQTGTGVKVGAQHKIFEQGPSKMTNHPYDMMIEGNGFFQVRTVNGDLAFTRAGNFHRDAQGRVMLSNGALIEPPIVVPPTALTFAVSPNGEVKCNLPGGDGGETTIGQIQVARFTNEAGLSSVGDGLYKVTPASGGAQLLIPGEGGAGQVAQGALEGSNVNVANSMVDMISTQRAYEMNTKVMGVADQMLQATVNIK